MDQVCVSLKITDGNHEYDSKLILTSSEKLTSASIARYMADFFGEDTRQDRHDSNLFWDRGDVRNVLITGTTHLSDAEFDFLKHFLDVASVKL